MSDDERIPAALRSTHHPGAHGRRAGDPLLYCVFTTVAVLAWIAGPFAVGVMAALGLGAYGRSVRHGSRATRCLLRDTRLVLAYLGVVFLVAVVAAARTVTG